MRFILVFMLIGISLYSQDVDFSQILDNVELEEVVGSDNLNYLVNETLEYFEEPSEDSPSKSVYTETLYTLGFVAEPYWYLCISDAGDKGYVDISTISRYLGTRDESDIINDDERFSRIGPNLLVSMGSLPTQNLSMDDYSYMGYVTFYRVVYTDSDYFVIQIETFENYAYYLIPFNDLTAKIQISGIPHPMEENLFVSLGRSFYPPDYLMFIQVDKDQMNLLYSARVLPNANVDFDNHPVMHSHGDSIRIVYEGMDDVIVQLDSNRLPRVNSKLDVVYQD